MLDDIDAWMERRKGEVGQFTRDAEAAGRRAWNDATRTGQDVVARTQAELANLGAQRLQQRQSPAGAVRHYSDPEAADEALAAGLAGVAGNAVGVGRGVLHSVEGLGQGALFATRLLDPDDAEINGADNSAWGQVFNAGKAVVNNAKQGIANPAGVVSDMHKLGHQLYVDTVPSATPMANTFGGEIGRNFRIGANEGELWWDLGSLAFGGAGSKALRGLGGTAEISGPAKFVAKEFSPAQAEYLAAPYEGMGHHFVPRRVSKALGLPTVLSDSSLNVLKPTRMSRGDFYELHYRVDPRFHGAWLPGGGRGWSGKDLGLKKYGLLGSLWHGSPAPLNATFGAGGAASLAKFEPSGGGEQ